jgi:pyruvate dehydrogenase E2 component (dihydrolipoamide acetyltransferase)
MAYQVVMPRLGWAMEKGRLVEWLKADGDPVQVGDILFTVESDKALQEVEALEGGTLRIPPHSPPPGAEMPVGTLLAYLLGPDEAMPAGQPAPAVVEKTLGQPSPAEAIPAPTAAGPQPGRKVAISPRARRVARELGVDWALIRGSGRTGRIVERDIRRAASTEPQGALPVPATPSHLAQPAWSASGPAPDLGQRPAAVTLHTQADATDLLALANSFSSTWPAGSLLVPAPLCLMCKLVALALQEHPLLNASLQDGRIVLHRPVHLTLAMEGEGAFRWPVIRDVPQLSVQRIAEEANRLLEHTRAGALPPEDMRGGTFSLIDLGEYGVDAFTPLIVAPQCAVLGLGRIALAPSVYEGRIVPRHKVALSLTFDHRIIGGAPAARFLKTVREYVEQPYLWLFR